MNLSHKNGYAGKPVGARRDDNGNITHILFQYRARAMPLQAARRAVTAKKTFGLRLCREGSGLPSIVLNGELKSIRTLDDLPEV